MRNSETLVAIFGHWPSFHDAEVVAWRLDRAAGELGAPGLEVDVHLFEMTSDVDARGFYVLRHHTLATLRFDGIDELDLDGFNGQNVISELEIEATADQNRLAVVLDTSSGLAASFTCSSGSVVRAEPFDPS